MTEQEFRQALICSVSDAGLSPERQQKVLAAMKGEERTVRTSNKMKITLVLAAVMLLGSTVALAAGIMGYVKWDGTAVENPYPLVASTPMPAVVTEDPMEAVSEATTRILNSTPQGEAVCVTYLENTRISHGIVQDIGVSTIEEAQQRIAPSQLPWPGHIPEGYALSYGWTNYLCSTEGTYELIDTEVTEENLRVERLRLPEEHAVLKEYTLHFEDEKGHALTIYAEMKYNTGDGYVAIEDHASVQAVQAPGMDNALLLGPRESTGSQSLHMRRILDEQVMCLMPERTLLDGAFVVDAYDEILIYVEADALTEQELLDVFAK